MNDPISLKNNSFIRQVLTFINVIALTIKNIDID